MPPSRLKNGALASTTAVYLRARAMPGNWVHDLSAVNVSDRFTGLGGNTGDGTADGAGGIVVMSLLQPMKTHIRLAAITRCMGPPLKLTSWTRSRCDFADFT